MTVNQPKRKPFPAAQASFMLPYMSAPFSAELIVEPFLTGKRIDTFLARHFRNYSTFRLQRIVRAGEVRINDVAADNESRVYRDQRVTLRLIEPPDRLLPPTPGPLQPKLATAVPGLLDALDMHLGQLPRTQSAQR